MTKDLRAATLAVLDELASGRGPTLEQMRALREALGELAAAPRPIFRGTHTYAALEVSAAVYDEIAGKLRAAGYDHAFDVAEGAIDMHGIGLVKDESAANKTAGDAAMPVVAWQRPNGEVARTEPRAYGRALVNLADANAAIDAATVRVLEVMEKAKDAVYLERNQVVAALARVFPSGIARTAIEGWSEEWHGCVFIDLPTGQASWHFHDSQAHLFAGLPPYAKPWDGHSTEEKYRRLAALVSHRHVKRGSSYAVLGAGELQSSAGPVPEGAQLTAYRGADDGRLWFRPTAEFEDGRFERIEAAGGVQS